jgi:hypothetical protein
MDTDSTNRVTMFKTVDAYLDDNQTIWNSMAPMAAAAQHLKSQIAALDVAAQKQETPTGATADKGAARDALEDVAFLMCQALSVLGHNGSDQDLLARTNLSSSDLQRFPDDELANRATTILADANARKTDLAALQVTQANIDELTQSLTRFNAAKVSPRIATAERAVQTQSIPQLIRQANATLRNQIDPMVNLFRRSHPNFVAGYRGARVIVDRAASHAAPPPATQPTPAPAGS